MIGPKTLAGEENGEIAKWRNILEGLQGGPTVASRPKIQQILTEKRQKKERGWLRKLAAVRPPFLTKAAENRPITNILWKKHGFFHEILHFMSNF
jgi:hypothetical protein